MNIFESFRIALQNLSANKLRSGLTMLGVIIGVGAVIALVSIGRGAQEAITSQIQSVGTNLLYVRPGSSNEGGVRGQEGSAGTLTLEDAQALDQVPGIVGVAPEIDSFAQMVAGGNNTNARLVGTTPAFQTVRDFAPAAGEFINDSNVSARSTVACLGSSVAAQLFPDSDPLGQSIRINNVPFRVQCVMESKGGTGFLSQDTQVIVPLTTAQTRLANAGRFRGSSNINVINLKIADLSQSDAITQQVGEILRERHRVVEDDFTVQSQEDVLSAATAVTDTLTLFLGGVAAISLIVGGIGIMNIMLVSVTERTREIGIRKAVGAKRRDILLQFLTEATVLSVLGGIIGILLGWGISALMGSFRFGNTAVTPVVDLTAVLLAVIFSVAVGLFFGIYPAARASALRPIEALRYE
ncbi:MAG: Macrolide export ATP-binding/permease protein MacB [Anaerolineae bacterium]|nr:Macrolide export ATP-binding/permease protein MacB [Anaerolineae bacterium]